MRSAQSESVIWDQGPDGLSAVGAFSCSAADLTLVEVLPMRCCSGLAAVSCGYSPDFLAKTCAMTASKPLVLCQCRPGGVLMLYTLAGLCGEI